MTVKKLIEELKRFDENLTVVCAGGEDNLEPGTEEKLYNFDTDYYTGKEFILIPKNTKFISL